MKYKITSARKADTPALIRKRTFRLRGYNAPRLRRISVNSPIDIPRLFEFGHMYDPYMGDTEPKKVKRVRKENRFFSTIRASAALSARWISAKTGTFADTVSRKLEDIRRRRALRPRLPSLLPAICGALCAVIAVAALSAGAVLYKLFLRDYFGRYELRYVPDFIGSSYPDSEVFSASEYCNLSISYEYSETAPEGQVISQTPSAGVGRRVYPDKSLCNVSIVVSLGERTFTMNDYSESSLRDAVLELKNESVKFSVIESYSDTVEAGRIISTSPAVGEIFSAEDTVTLNVSLGAKVVYVTVPNIFGLTEQRAEATLISSGLTVGSITYISSDLPEGTVISQSASAYSTEKEGTAVSFSVSVGNRYSQKTVPDLFGLTIAEAKAKLAEYGLVCGRIYAVGNGAPTGTVVAQSPLPGTPINSSIVSVDIYVSS